MRQSELGQTKPIQGDNPNRTNPGQAVPMRQSMSSRTGPFQPIAVRAEETCYVM